MLKQMEPLPESSLLEKHSEVKKSIMLLDCEISESDFKDELFRAVKSIFPEEDDVED